LKPITYKQLGRFKWLALLHLQVVLHSMSTDDLIRSRLLHAEDTLLRAVEDDDDAVEAFRGTWSTLQLDIDKAAQAKRISGTTIRIAAAVAARIGILADNVLDFHSRSDTLSASLQTDLDTIFAQVDQRHPSGNSRSSTSADVLALADKRYPCPPYIASAYKWLRHNIHKPYPTVEEIKSICANSDTSEKRIRNWFISARRRMGWSKIAKEHFHSDREDTADAAYRALVEPDPKRPIEAKLMFEFVKMEVAAEGMYSSAFKPSQFAGSLGTTVVGMSMEHKARIEEMRQQAIEEENIRKAVEHQMKRQRVTKRNGSQRTLVSLYPSPERSSCSSPEPTLVLSETEEDETAISLPGAAAGHKRCRSLSFDTLDSHADKRHKCVTCPVGILRSD
jgi:hypothetical protein